MTTKIDDARVAAGRLIHVKNTKKPKFSNAKNEYLAVFVEDSGGGNERCLLFTERELKIAEHRASRNPEDLTKKSLLQDLLD
jgi:hypothetical protein